MFSENAKPSNFNFANEKSLALIITALLIPWLDFTLQFIAILANIFPKKMKRNLNLLLSRAFRWENYITWRRCSQLINQSEQGCHGKGPFCDQLDVLLKYRNKVESKFPS